jgi:hypothetical protein
LALVNNTSNGAIATLNFKVKDTAPEGQTNVVVTPVDARDVSGSVPYFEGAAGVVNVIQVITGDVDRDGEVSDWDAILLNRYLANWKVDIDLRAADIDHDGEVTDWDAITLERYLAGWPIVL